MRHIIFLLFLGMLFDSCVNAQPQKDAVSEILEVGEYAQRLQDPGVTIVDVRTSEEYAGGYIENAVNIDVNSDDFESHFADFDKNKPLYIYCRSGGRSQQAAQKLQNMGFQEIYDLKGGILAWKGALSTKN